MNRIVTRAAAVMALAVLLCAIGMGRCDATTAEEVARRIPVEANLFDPQALQRFGK